MVYKAANVETSGKSVVVLYKRYFSGYWEKREVVFEKNTENKNFNLDSRRISVIFFFF